MSILEGMEITSDENDEELPEQRVNSELKL